ncbi:MAG: RagB/SusD family nutrient uptake outer membrane protein [Bacteroidales bacterium]|nr:RagB/SusD family nutrient uptake outer membrane protein [Bacteroidales bacterium]
MKKVFYSIITIAVLLFAATSCTDVLDQSPVDSFNQEAVFKDIGLTKAFLGYCYDRIGSHGSAVLGGREDLLDAGTDQLLCIHRPSNYPNVKGTLTPDYMGHYSSTSRGGWLMWSGQYANIQRLNLLLANIDDVPAPTSTEEALKVQMKGEAYYIRAWNHAQLMFGHGGLVLNDQPYELGADFQSITRSTLQQTLDFILADIDRAMTNLPASGMEQGRATRAAAAALKARVLLFCASDLVNGGYEASNQLVSFGTGGQAARWVAARDAAKAIMDGTYGEFSLVGTTDDPPAGGLSEAQIQEYSDIYFNIFNQKGQWNSETIWAIQYPLTGGNYYRPNQWNGPNGYHNWGNNDPIEASVRKFEMADGTPFVWDIGQGDFLRQATAAQLEADPLLNPYNGREPRFYAIVLYHGAPWQQRPTDIAGMEPNNRVQTGHIYDTDGTRIQAGVDTRQARVEAWNGTKNGYYLKKFMDPTSVGQYYRNTNHWVEFRYAEILLNYAEACIEVGTPADIQNGLDALNMVRNRAGLPDRVTADQAEAREFVRHERFIEMFAEGHRWYDIRRWMICPEVIHNQNVYEMQIKEYVNGDMEWLHAAPGNGVVDPALADGREWVDKNYWLPILRNEMNRAPNLQQNPGY